MKLPTGPVCPECSAAAGVPIIYGMPTMEMMKAVDDGHAAFGGCVIEMDEDGTSRMPDWACPVCQHRWGTPVSSTQTPTNLSDPVHGV